MYVLGLAACCIQCERSNTVRYDVYPGVFIRCSIEHQNLIPSSYKFLWKRSGLSAKSSPPTFPSAAFVRFRTTTTTQCPFSLQERFCDQPAV